MRLLIIISVLMSACTGQKTVSEKSNIPAKTYTVTGKLEQKQRYCGGARPSQQMLDKFKIPKPLKAYTIYVKQGTINDPNAAIIDSTTTNDMGEYRLDLPSGEYVFISKTQLSLSNLKVITHQKNMKISDQECLDDWFRSGLIQFTVKDKAIIDLNFIRNNKCDIPDGIPCLKHTGPIRP